MDRKEHKEKLFRTLRNTCATMGAGCIVWGGFQHNPSLVLAIVGPVLIVAAVIIHKFCSDSFLFVRSE